MRHHRTVITAVAAATMFLLLAMPAAAQIVINIPGVKVPKIKVKPTPTPTPDESDSSTTPSSNNNNRDDDDSSSASPVKKPCTGDAVLDVHLENIETTRKQAEEYKPGLRDYYVQDFNDRQNIYLKASLSASRRADFLGNWPKDFRDCINPALDNLATVARKTLPTYTPTGYTIRNPAEEKLMRAAINDISTATVIRGGLLSANWKIDKDNYNFPTARYKHGMIYARYPNLDDGFCRIIYVNIVQDYAGGGTYGASEGRFIKSEYAGCPAGGAARKP